MPVDREVVLGEILRWGERWAGFLRGPLHAVNEPKLFGGKEALAPSHTDQIQSRRDQPDEAQERDAEREALLGAGSC